MLQGEEPLWVCCCPTGKQADMVSWLRPRSFPLHSVQEPTWALPATSKLLSSLEMSMTAALLAQFGTCFFPHPVYIIFLVPLFASLLRSFQTFPTSRKFAIPLRMQIQIQPRFLHWWHQPPIPYSSLLQWAPGIGGGWDQHWCSLGACSGKQWLAVSSAHPALGEKVWRSHCHL